MRRKSLTFMIALLVFTSLLLPQGFAKEVQSSSDCIILVEGSVAFLSTYADGLHALLDLLPADLQLGLLATGQSTNLQLPVALSRTRRAELHAFVEQTYLDKDTLPESDWEAMLSSSVSLLASRGAVRSTIIVLRSDASLPERWEDLAHMAAEWGILLLDVDLNLPQSRQTASLELRRPGQFSNEVWARLPKLLGLATAELTSLAYSDSGMQLGVLIPAGVKSLILQWDRSAVHQVLLTTPSGELIDPLADSFQPQLFEGPSYTCVHLTPAVLPTLDDWQGQWRISASGSIGLGVWFCDPAWLQATVRETKGQRIISVATGLWEMAHRAGEQVTVRLLDWRGEPLLELNDLGINGDGMAGDDIFSTIVPSFIGPGPAIIQVSGSSVHQLTVMVPASSPWEPLVPDESDVTGKLLLLGLGMTISGWGMVRGGKKTSVTWRISHRAADGHWHSYDMTTRQMLAGSGDGCQIRLARQAATKQLRLRLTDKDELRLDVLAEGQAIFVNDVQVFIGAHLEHGDCIQLIDERLLVERLAYLRSGKHVG